MTHATPHANSVRDTTEFDATPVNAEQWRCRPHRIHEAGPEETPAGDLGTIEEVRHV